METLFAYTLVALFAAVWVAVVAGYVAVVWLLVDAVNLIL